MRKLLNTLKYGDSRTKAFLWGIILTFFAAAICLVLAFVLGNIMFGGLTFALAIVGLILIHTAGFSDDNIGNTASQGKAGSTGSAVRGGRTANAGNVKSSEANSKTENTKLSEMGDKAENINPVKASGKTENSSSANEAKKSDNLAADADSRLDNKKPAQTDTTNGTADQSNKAVNADNTRLSDKKSKNEALSSDRYGRSDKADKSDTPDDHVEDFMSHYTKASLKKLFKSARVSKENVPILIDLCPSLRVRQCPAYVWKHKKNVCFLLLEESPRTVTFDISQIQRVTYQKGVSANPLTDYDSLKYSEEIDEKFGVLLPRYYTAGTAGKYTNHKNLYVIAKDMALTAFSLRELMKLFEFSFEMSDPILNDRSFGDTFREAYRMRMLFADGVVNQKDYQERIRQMLLAMAKDNDMSDREFDRSLQQMIYYRLITKEYAEFFEAKRLEKAN